MIRNRIAIAAVLALVGILAIAAHSVDPQTAATDPLPSWNAGASKQAILDFVRASTTPGTSMFVPAPERIAVFDQDGTLWVEQPMYTQVAYCLDRVPVIAAANPALKEQEPFKTVLSGDRTALARLTAKDVEVIALATLSGMTVDEFREDVAKWLATASDPRWKRPYTELTYQPMHEVMELLRANGFKIFIVTGGGQDFVRVYAEKTYGVPPEQVVGSADTTKFTHDKSGAPVLMKEPKLLLFNDGPGKPEGIHLVIGRRPVAAFGNSGGDQQMLEYTGAGSKAHLCMLVLHDDKEREYAYGPAEGLPDSKVGTFGPALFDAAKKNGWSVISMKRDWKQVFKQP